MRRKKLRTEEKKLIKFWRGKNRACLFTRAEWKRERRRKLGVSLSAVVAFKESEQKETTTENKQTRERTVKTSRRKKKRKKNF